MLTVYFIFSGMCLHHVLLFQHLAEGNAGVILSKFIDVILHMKCSLFVFTSS